MFLPRFHRRCSLQDYHVLLASTGCTNASHLPPSTSVPPSRCPRLLWLRYVVINFPASELAGQGDTRSTLCFYLRNLPPSHSSHPRSLFSAESRMLACISQIQGVTASRPINQPALVQSHSSTNRAHSKRPPPSSLTPFACGRHARTPCVTSTASSARATWPQVAQI